MIGSRHAPAPVAPDLGARVTGNRDKAGLAPLREIADQTVAQGRSALTGRLVIYRDGWFQLSGG